MSTVIDEDPVLALRQDIAETFTELRLEQGWSKKEAARQLGVIYSNLNRLEAAGTDLRLSTLQKYAHAYGYQVEVAFVPMEEEDEAHPALPSSA
jgi:transcriptional regulator with XRE-family HTH domain